MLNPHQLLFLCREVCWINTLEHLHFRFSLGVWGMCLGSSPALEGSEGVKIFGWETSCSQKWSDLILLCSCFKPSLIPHYIRAAFKCFIQSPWGPFLTYHKFFFSTPTSILCPNNSKLQKIVNLPDLCLLSPLYLECSPFLSALLIY